jgi:CheY-like chemotaxis protein
MNGMQFLEALKKDESCNAIPVIAYSTSILPSDKEKVLQLGADYFFIKPSSHQKLIEELTMVFNTIKRQSVSL